MRCRGLAVELTPRSAGNTANVLFPREYLERVRVVAWVLPVSYYPIRMDDASY